MASSNEGRVLKRANPNTIQGKFLVGYQGWFTCGGDGPPVHNGHHGWLHWFSKPLPDGGKPTFDLWPDVSSYTPSELFPVPGLTLSDGSQALLFSSRHPRTVRRHFNWMAQHAVDGAFYQRFASQCEADGRSRGAVADLTRLRDEVLDRVRESAEGEGRVWAVMYDVSGVPDDRVEKVVKADWAHLVCDKRILDSPFYLKEGERPVIALWGFGFAGRKHNPDTVRSVVRHIRSVTPGGAYIIAGTPTHWRTLQGDADPNPEFLSIWYTEFDAISPWTVGRFRDEESIDRFAREKLLPDVSALQDPRNTHGRKVDYIPVVFPGGSGFNMTDGRWGLNAQRRDGGRFLWRQVYHALRTAGAKIVYGAMWDEYDEGTAFLPAVSKKRELPVEQKFIALDADGYDLPPDWYMRIAGFAGEMVRSERELHESFPVKDLQDYWSSRPKYEPTPHPSNPQSQISPGAIAGGSGSSNNEGVTQTFEEWCEQEKDNANDLPPPPYTLEAGPESDPTRVGHQQQPEPQTQRNERSEGEERPPVVPLQTRPDSIPVHDGGGPQVPLASRPFITTSTSGSGADYGSTRPPEVPLASRPGPPGVGEGSHPYPQTYQAQQGYAPVYVNVPHASSKPSEGAPAPTIPPQNHYPPNPEEQASSMSNLTDQFGRQTLNGGGVLNSSIPPSNFTSTMSSGPPTFSQWPPADWGVTSSASSQQQTYPISSLPPQPTSSSRPPPPPVHPARPGSRPPPSPGTSSTSSIPNSPLTPGFGPGLGGGGGGFGRPGSTSPRPGASSSVIPGPGPGPGYGPGPGPGGGFGGTMPGNGIPPPLSTAGGGISFPHAHASPSISTSTSTGSNTSTSDMAFPGAYPDVTQGYVGNVMPFPSFVPGTGVGVGGPSSGGGYGPGGFYMGSGYGSSSGPGIGSGTGFPSSHPPPPPPPPRRYNQAPPPPPPSHPSLHTPHQQQQGYGSSYSQFPSYAGVSSQADGAGGGTGPGGMYPPHIPTRTSPSPSPSPTPSSSQFPSQPAPTTPIPNTNTPGGFVPGPPPAPSSGRFGIPNTLGVAVDKFAGAGTRRKIEGGIESLSSAGSKVYQRFRP